MRTLRDLSRAAWPDASELRIGLGCMRLSTDEARDERRALETITAAVQAGITVFDTAHAYGHGPDELGHNERLLARALRGAGAAERARIVTKGGMTRAGGGWIADGRAKAIRADCEASLEALDGIPIDLYLIHAPDPRTPWSTSVRALARLVDDGVVRRVGVANVNRRQLDEALDHAPIAAVQVALNPFDDSALRGGVLERCVERGIALVAHSPLGGPRRAGSVDRQQALVDVAESHGATPAEVALAWLLELSPVVIPIPGARRPETARSAARAAALELDDADRATLAAAFGGARPAPASSRSAAGAGEVVVVMGIPGAGKSQRRRGLRGARLRPPQPRRARRLAPLARGDAGRGARVGHPAARPRQHVPHTGIAELRRRGGREARGPGSLRLARHASRAGAGQPRAAAARALRLAPDPRGGARGGRSASRGSTRRRRRCARSGSSSLPPTTRVSRSSSGSSSSARRPAARPAPSSSPRRR